MLTTDDLLVPGPYQIPVLVKDNHNRACELPQTVLLEACFCDPYLICSQSSTTTIHSGDTHWVITEDTYGTVTDDGVRQSNVSLGPAGIGMIVLGLLLLLCKYCRNLFSQAPQKQSYHQALWDGEVLLAISFWLSVAILGLIATRSDYGQ